MILAAVQAGGWLTVLAVLAMLNAAAAAFYYLRVVVYMYMRDPHSRALQESRRRRRRSPPPSADRRRPAPPFSGLLSCQVHPTRAHVGASRLARREDRGRATREPGPGHRSARRKISQVSAWGAHDDSGATNARVVPGWQDLPGKS